MAVRVGSMLAGRYEITAPIATGGMGEVWQARDRTLGRIIAVKVLRSEYTGDSSFLIRFRNEARHTAALSHPNIASVYDYGETTEDGQRLAYLIMEFVEGKPLVTVLAERGRLTAEQTLDVLGQAGDGLSAAHAAGMVHRDIKPGNLLVRPDGVVKLTDFGIAYARDAAPLTRTGMVVGTAQYLSPEQAQGHVVTAASDVYSLGVLGYECIAGVRPFDGESQVAIALAQINRPPPPMPADVPWQVRALIERCLAKDPAARFPDGAAFSDAVRRVAAGGTVPAATAMTQVVGDDGTATTMLPATGPGTALGPTTAPRTMPPLHGPPVDGDGASTWTGGEADPQDVRRTRLLWAAAALALVGLIAAGVFLLQLGSDDPDGSAASPGTSSASASASASSSASGTFAFDVTDYVGDDADTVADELEELGFEVRQREATATELAAADVALAENAVVTANPARATLTPGATVTLAVAAEAYAPEAEQDGDEGDAPAPAAPTPDSEDDEDDGPTTPTTATVTATVTRSSQPTTSNTSTSAAPTSTSPTSSAAPTSTSPTSSAAQEDGALGQTNTADLP
ncbi:MULTISPECIES: serine/threonine-protein kinase [unclassified Modestobacter]|uniref:serine/threonine-protein kinase n=1 Tax=unclassified Modestobacter TaxID=2643866 RepID=UPI0022AABD39|nr:MULTISPECIES: serine/threonine-protein kinase [unclassified Modestobacter]MCZ2822967.1 protein kinase [Modestobacter sp. VKM Ac-2981]MCZ2851213.1 protein kinase [Modestobacter sp. VKM Ac-2982]